MKWKLFLCINQTKGIATSLIIIKKSTVYNPHSFMIRKSIGRLLYRGSLNEPRSDYAGTPSVPLHLVSEQFLTGCCWLSVYNWSKKIILDLLSMWSLIRQYRTVHTKRFKVPWSVAHTFELPVTSLKDISRHTSYKWTIKAFTYWIKFCI